eukprot:NODE_3290_length_575_cov_29.195817_g2770_i0.p1 GENE.NODE_3290_length_575_cov_29.195817_g2770_i0~~NODE_3290_length_575_cov_29.195817_g2770_i0.p1  ORF type:complete len:190 (-),score=52.59 NODE_3290_length_575_cov_29.195817_g2770_i0:5-520(-)
MPSFFKRKSKPPPAPIGATSTVDTPTAQHHRHKGDAHTRNKETVKSPARQKESGTEPDGVERLHVLFQCHPKQRLVLRFPDTPLKELTVPGLKRQIETISGIPANSQLLVYQGEELPLSAMGSELGLTNGCTIYLNKKRPGQTSPPNTSKASTTISTNTSPPRTASPCTLR